jgi:DNA-binding Xre family transcriptional regulator
MAILIRMPLNFQEIERRRKAKELTHEEAATRAARAMQALGYGKRKFTRQQWFQIESGRFPDARISTVEVICAVLECKIEDLLTSKGGRR